MTSHEFFLVCIRADDDEDVAVGRVYRACEDAAGARSGFVRVWDESGEDYLYPAEHFVRVDVRQGDRDRLEGALAHVS